MREETIKPLMLGLLALVAGFWGCVSIAHAQSLSARGVVSGGDLVSAAVPQAGNIFTVIDEVQALQGDVADCAKQGLFFDGTTCRSANPPIVAFRQIPTQTYVDVQNATPGSGTETYPLDGEDGTVTLLD